MAPAASRPARPALAAAAALAVLALLPAVARAQYPKYLGYYGPVTGNNRAAADRCSQGVMAGSRAYRDMLTQGRCPTPCIAVQWMTPVNDARDCVMGYEVEVRGDETCCSCASSSLFIFPQEEKKNSRRHDRGKKKTSPPKPPKHKNKTRQQTTQLTSAADGSVVKRTARQYDTGLVVTGLQPTTSYKVKVTTKYNPLGSESSEFEAMSSSD
jgi:hypothetical protein